MPTTGEDGVGVVVPPGAADDAALLTGAAGRTVAVNARETTVAFVKEHGLEVDAVLERTGDPDRDAVNALASRHDGDDLPVHVLPAVGHEWLDDRADPRTYQPRRELADDLFDETSVGDDREVSVTGLLAVHGKHRRTALDVRLVDRDEDGRTERVRNEVRAWTGRPVRDDADNPRSVVLAGGARHASRRSAADDLNGRLRSGPPRVGAVTHPAPDSRIRSDLLDRLDHGVLVVGGTEFHPDRRGAAEARGTGVRRAGTDGVALELTPAGLSVSTAVERAAGLVDAMDVEDVDAEDRPGRSPGR